MSVGTANSFALWWNMIEAQQECIEEPPIADDMIVLQFMGSGASHQVTAADIRAVCKLIKEHCS